MKKIYKISVLSTSLIALMSINSTEALAGRTHLLGVFEGMLSRFSPLKRFVPASQELLQKQNCVLTKQHKIASQNSEKAENGQFTLKIKGNNSSLLENNPILKYFNGGFHTHTYPYPLFNSSIKHLFPYFTNQRRFNSTTPTFLLPSYMTLSDKDLEAHKSLPKEEFKETPSTVLTAEHSFEECVEVVKRNCAGTIKGHVDEIAGSVIIEMVKIFSSTPLEKIRKNDGIIDYLRNLELNWKSRIKELGNTKREKGKYYIENIDKMIEKFYERL